jgi:hypothetical protein
VCTPVVGPKWIVVTFSPGPVPCVYTDVLTGQLAQSGPESSCDVVGGETGGAVGGLVGDELCAKQVGPLSPAGHPVHSRPGT